MDFKNRNVVITGAKGQLGTSLCQKFAALSANVIGLDLESSPFFDKPLSEVSYRYVDLSNTQQIQKVFQTIKQDFGDAHILINNAGIACFEPFTERKEDNFDRVMDVNLKGTFYCLQNFVKCFGEGAKGKSIVNIASFYGVVSPDPRIYTDCARNSSEIYGATKAGVIQMTRYFAVHLAKQGLRVNCVSPGGIFNPKQPQGEDFVKNYSFRCPMNRMGTAQEVANAVLFLASDDASYINGQNLVVDGGMTCW